MSEQSMPQNIIKIGADVFVIKNNKLLLGKRKGKGTGNGMWGLPGGHVEYGESLIGAARRELLEETGLTADDFSFLHVVNDVQTDGGHYIHVCFLAQGVMGEPKLMEPEFCYEWCWFDFNNLPDNIFYGHNRLIPAFLEKQVYLDSVL